MLWETHRTEIEGTQRGYMARIIERSTNKLVSFQHFTMSYKDGTITEQATKAYERAKIFVSAAERECEFCLTHTADGGRCVCGMTSAAYPRS